MQEPACWAANISGKHTQWPPREPAMTESPEKNPFLDLRTRSLLWWCLAGSVALGILLPSEALLEYGIYAVILLWVGWQIRRRGISTQRLVGALSRDSAWIPRI